MRHQGPYATLQGLCAALSDLRIGRYRESFQTTGAALPVAYVGAGVPDLPTDASARLMAARIDAPIILCCAEENEVALVTIVDELHREGLAPEVLTGVDSDGALLAGALDRTPGPALFILCQSDELDKAATRRLSGLFSARKGPAHHLVTVPLAPSRPLASLPPIRAALEELRGAAPEPRGGGAPGRGDLLMRDVVGTTDVSALKDRAHPHAAKEALARELHREMVAAEALMTRGAPATVPARPSKPATPRAVEVSSRPVAPPTGGAEPGAPLSLMAEEDVARALSPEGSLPDGLGPVAVAAPEENPLSRVPSLLDLVPTELTPTDERVTRRGQTAPHDDAQQDAALGAPLKRPRPQTNRVLLFVAIMAIAALSVMAVLHMSASPPNPSSGSGAVNRGAPTPVAPSDNASAATPRASSVPAPDAGAAAETGSETEGPPDSVAEGGAVRPKTPPPPSDREALLIDQAIADGRVRALDTLLIWPSSKESMTWAEASKYCRGRRLGSLRRWRLATTAELTRLNRSRMLPTGIYWSRNRNEEKDEAQALATVSREFADYLVVESAARPACLRRR